MKQWLKVAAALGLTASLLMTAGCSKGAETESVKKTVPEGQKVKVYTTLQAQADFVREIGKDKVEVQTYLPEGTNFWQWAPTLKEVRDLYEADVFVLNGHNTEDRWLDQTKADVKLHNRELLWVDPTEGLEKLPLLKYNNPDANEQDRAKERKDPWHYLDPQNAKKEVDAIAAALAKKAPSYKEEFQKNAEEYKKKLDALDQKFADMIQKAKRKEIVSPYPAYQYFAKRYGLKYSIKNSFALNEIPWDNPPKKQEIKEDLAKHDLYAVLFEDEAAPRTQEFLGELGYKSRVFRPYEGKSSVGKNMSYLETMEENYKVLEEVLNK
jgi:zinc transport system substrate-binding protein